MPGRLVPVARYVPLLLEAVAIIALSIITANFTCPQFLQADVIMYSLISLRHLTLFYWGQNRLADLLPFILSIFGDPKYNLYYCLIIANIFFYGLFLCISEYIAVLFKVVGWGGRGLSRRFVFAIFVLLISVLLYPVSLFRIGTAHYEWTAAPMCILISFSIIIASERSRVWRFCLSTGVLAIGIGVNFSMILVALGLAVGYGVLVRRVNWDVIGFGLLAIIITVAWILVSYEFRGPDIPYSYSGFNFSNLNAHTTQAIVGLVETVRTGPAIILLCFVTLAEALIGYFQKHSELQRIKSAVIYASVAFSAGWIVVFSGSTWVQMNQVNFRYFMPVLILFVSMLTLCTSEIVWLVLSRVQRLKMAQEVFAVVVLVCSCAYMYKPIVAFQDYAIFRKVRNLPAAELRIYAGDYWRVWPAVMEDMLDGRKSFGLAYRAVGDVNELDGFAARKGLVGKPISIGCLNSKISDCMSQARQWLGGTELIDSKKIGPNSAIMNVVLHSPVHPQAFGFTSGPALDVAAARLIELSDARVERVGNKLLVTVKLHNGSSQRVHALSPNPLRLSWRFPTASEPIRDGWDPRVEIGEDVAPGATKEISFGIPAYGHKAGAPLQVTFVVEGKFWAHDVGVMPVNVRWYDPGAAGGGDQKVVAGAWSAGRRGACGLSKEAWVVKIGRKVSVSSHDADAGCVLGVGWSHSESWGTWTNGKVAKLKLDIGGEPAANMMLTLDLRGFGRDNKQAVSIWAGGHEIGSMVLDTRVIAEHHLVIPWQEFRRGRILLTFRVADPVSPKELGISADSRKLGLGLQWLRFDLAGGGQAR